MADASGFRPGEGARARSCAKYYAGHHIHWIQFNVARRSTSIRSGSIVAVGSDHVLVRLGSGVRRYWTHATTSLAVGQRVIVYGSGSMMRVIVGDGSQFVSIASDRIRSDCATDDPIQKVLPVLTRRMPVLDEGTEG